MEIVSVGVFLYIRAVHSIAYLFVSSEIFAQWSRKARQHTNEFSAIWKIDWESVWGGHHAACQSLFYSHLLGNSVDACVVRVYANQINHLCNFHIWRCYCYCCAHHASQQRKTSRSMWRCECVRVCVSAYFTFSVHFLWWSRETMQMSFQIQNTWWVRNYYEYAQNLAQVICFYFFYWLLC